MSHFIQIHTLTSYPPSCLNRDDLGRPKSAVMGGSPRLRISSQCLKRAWRVSEIFDELQARGTRTRRMGRLVFEKLQDGGIQVADAHRWAHTIVSPFGSVTAYDKIEKSKDPEPFDPSHLDHAQIVHYGLDEQDAINATIANVVETKEAPDAKSLDLLRHSKGAVDIAMFGRMLAATPTYSVEAAVHVSHAITTHKVAVETDWFSAVDDLNTGVEDQGAGHIGEAEYGAGVYYGYSCIDRDLLLENLGGNEELAKESIKALIRAGVTVSPSGKSASFGSDSVASYCMAEVGRQQPRNLSSAFLKPVTGEDYMAESINRIEQTVKRFDGVYGEAPKRIVLDAYSDDKPVVTISQVLDFATAANSEKEAA